MTVVELKSMIIVIRRQNANRSQIVLFYMYCILSKRVSAGLGTRELLFNCLSSVVDLTCL